jgi:hypothetical protein
MGTTRLGTYRVEHRERGAVADLGELTAVPAHPRSLDPFVGALLREGRAGIVVLVDAAGIVVARRVVRPFRPRQGANGPTRPGSGQGRDDHLEERPRGSPS